MQVYPAYLPDGRAGELRVFSQGLLTVFEIRTPPHDALVRMSVYGEREGYLGVLQPGADGLTLTRRFSRQALSGFPSHITHAAPAGAGERGREKAGAVLALLAALLEETAEPEWEPVRYPRRWVVGPLRRALFDVTGALLSRRRDTVRLAVPVEEAALRGIPVQQIEGRDYYILTLPENLLPDMKKEN